MPDSSDSPAFVPHRYGSPQMFAAFAVALPKNLDRFKSFDRRKRMKSRLALSGLLAILSAGLPAGAAYGGVGSQPMPAPAFLFIEDLYVEEEVQEGHFFTSSMIRGLNKLTPDQKAELLLKAVKRGNPDAQFRWAERLYGKFKKQRLLPAAKGSETYLEEALFWYESAATQDHAAAQRRFADFHATGEGMPSNPMEATRLYRLSANQGDARSQLQMGRHNEEGINVPANLEKTVRWYERAAKQTAFPDVANVARYRLGKIYESEQVEKAALQGGLVDAYMWFNLAAKGGHKDADMERLKIEKHMSLAEIVKAKKQARQWLATLAMDSKTSATEKTR